MDADDRRGNSLRYSSDHVRLACVCVYAVDCVRCKVSAATANSWTLETQSKRFSEFRQNKSRKLTWNLLLFLLFTIFNQLLIPQQEIPFEARHHIGAVIAFTVAIRTNVFNLWFVDACPSNWLLALIKQQKKICIYLHFRSVNRRHPN